MPIFELSLSNPDLMRTLSFLSLLLLGLGHTFAQLTYSAEKPVYWNWEGKPIMLIGGSAEDNLFQLPYVEAHLDSLVAVGGNYVRNTMSSRDAGNRWPFAKTDSLYDLNQWDEVYWQRFADFLTMTAERGIFVQLEVWATFDFYRENWLLNPFNPKNNRNYTPERTNLLTEVPTHPIFTDNPFFYAVPTSLHNPKLLEFQQKYVDKLLSYSLAYDHVLYCMDNETSVPSTWGIFWAKYIQTRARLADKMVHTTEMWDPHDLYHPAHDETLLRPEVFSFVDVSQNNHQVGQQHYDNGRAYLARMHKLDVQRPANNVKIYGAGVRYGRVQDGTERFWRNAFLGMASVRFHRPPAGLGLSATARAHIQSLRRLFDRLPFASCEPLPDLLAEREENEAYCLGKKGEAYAVYFPAGGSVTLQAEGVRRLNWLNIQTSEWGSPQQVSSAQPIELRAPNQGHWVALLEQ
jgi:hypothetical protein